MIKRKQNCRFAYFFLVNRAFFLHNVDNFSNFATLMRFLRRVVIFRIENLARITREHITLLC